MCTAVGVAVLVALATGCSHRDGAATGTGAGPAATATSPAPTGAPSGYADMEKKVNAAESAANAADRDAADDGN